MALVEALASDARLVVFCDQVRDPGNLGTVIRCADAFGADAVLISTDAVELYNPKTVRASTGSLFHLPIAVGVDLSVAAEAARRPGSRCSVPTVPPTAPSTTYASAASSPDR